MSLGSAPDSAIVVGARAEGVRWQISCRVLRVHLQRFNAGEAIPGGGDRARAVLEPYFTETDPQHRFARLTVGDDGAAVYLDDNDLMVNHAGRERVWDILIEAATAAQWTILPDGPPCLTSPTRRSELLEELASEAVLVTNGADHLVVLCSI